MYMRSIVTKNRVAWSVGRSITLVSPPKTAEPIKMPLGLRTRVGAGSMYRDNLRSSVQLQPGGANVPTWEGTLVPAVEYD